MSTETFFNVTKTISGRDEVKIESIGAEMTKTTVLYLIYNALKGIDMPQGAKGTAFISTSLTTKQFESAEEISAHCKYFKMC